MSWKPGDTVVERQIWHGQITAAMATVVIESTSDHLVTYAPPGAPFGFDETVAFPSPSGRHPRYGLTGWRGNGLLTVTPTTGDFAVQHFWVGPDRQFACWYLNIQEPMRSTSIGIDTQDLELDIVIGPDGESWELKDDEVLEQRVAEGRWTAEEISAIRAVGRRIVREIVEPSDWWWDKSWSAWEPDPAIEVPSFPDGWRDVPVEPYTWSGGDSGQ